MDIFEGLRILDAVNTDLIIIISVIGAVVVVGIILFFVLNKFFLVRKRCNKTLKDLVKKYEYLHALLTGQDLQYIQRLEIISRTNLLYVDIHSSYFKRSKEIRDTIDVSVSNVLTDLGEYLEEKKYKEFKQYYKEHLGIIRQYENSVNQLNNDLVQVIKPEEECREAALALKEKLRELKSKYNLNEDKLQFVTLSFERVFDNIDRTFNEFEGKVETADYDDANRIIPRIDKVIDVLSKLIDEIPSLVDEYTNKIPSRVDELQTKYHTLLREGKPLKHLQVEEKIEAINSAIDNAKDQIKKLSVSTLASEAETINKEIDKIFASFDKEVEASLEFKKKKDNVLTQFNEYEKEYIKIKNNINKFRKVYIIDPEHENLLTEMNTKLDIVSKDKRRLDVYIHAVESSPYSVLIEKVNVLEKGTQDFGEKVDTFRNYLASLKNDSEGAFSNLKVRYEQLKNAEYTIREWKISDFTEKYRSHFDICYQYIDECFHLLNSVPIDVNAVNVCTNKLNESTNNLIKEIQEIDNYKKRAVEQILLANRDRMKFAEINNLVNQSETLYLSGEFKSAFESSDNIIKKLNLRDGK